ncbi:MAG: hypothetical protein A2632_01260 [Candidatus Pacebacteria bacterium RIFCSPHIGHO2_01_FULL_46_16]|nr:MAG: hypothetical protein A2632_01260 [Candidatus Pacebacteria bacterium RIFCSPHIGHO2_01_FULL_46_16]
MIYHMFQIAKNLARPFRTHKYLLLQLIQREIKARYKQSIIGYFWVLLNPLAQMLIYTFVFSMIFRFPSSIPYPAFLLAALLPWTFFSGSLVSATNSLVGNDTLLKKVAFPREIIPYSVIVAKGIDFLFATLIFIALLLYYQLPITSSIWMFIPLLTIQIILTVGISLALSAFNLFYRDIQYLANLLITVWMYLTPVVYPLSLVPKEFVWLYKLNPMVGIIEGYRSALFNFPFEYSIIIWSFWVSIIVFILGFIVFKKLEGTFADIV